jgi:2-polyprenyl-3-methyl-5-hydroxy-6-metoxy-1,4-benzoquinol methylase
MGKNNSKRFSSNIDNPSIREEYESYGIQGFYERFGDGYRNPHELAIRKVLRLVIKKWDINLRKVLDLACGSGEVTLTLESLGCTDIDGIDPYTYKAYLKRTGRNAEPYTFEQIAAGTLTGRKYSLIICSFALHLLEMSRLPLLLYQLGLIADSMIIITPNKRPYLKEKWGWGCLDEIVVEGVRARFYKHTYDK